MQKKRDRERNTQFQVKETQAAKRFRPPGGSRAIISRSIKARRVRDVRWCYRRARESYTPIRNHTYPNVWDHIQYEAKVQTVARV